MNESTVQYYIALFNSVSHVLHAESILKESAVPHKIVPVPRKISSDCGVCIRFLPEDRQDIESALAGKVGVFEIRRL